MTAPSLNDPGGGRSAVDPTLREAAIASDCRWLRQWNILREVALSGRVDLGRLRAALARSRRGPAGLQLLPRAHRRHRRDGLPGGTVFLNTNPGERATVDGAARAVMQQARIMTPMAKEWAVHWSRVGGPAADPDAAPQNVPPGLVPTAAVSSLGVWSLGPCGAQVLQVWAPPLAQAPLAVALGVVGVQGAVCLSFRFAAAMMGKETGVAFAQAVRGLLVEMSAGRPAYARS